MYHVSLSATCAGPCLARTLAFVRAAAAAAQGCEDEEYEVNIEGLNSDGCVYMHDCMCVCVHGCMCLCVYAWLYVNMYA
jgi:hypothetical protein